MNETKQPMGPAEYGCLQGALATFFGKNEALLHAARDLRVQENEIAMMFVDERRYCQEIHTHHEKAREAKADMDSFYERIVEGTPNPSRAFLLHRLDVRAGQRAKAMAAEDRARYGVQEIRRKIAVALDKKIILEDKRREARRDQRGAASKALKEMQYHVPAGQQRVIEIGEHEVTFWVCAAFEQPQVDYIKFPRGH
jgi:hypothetical protein